MTEKRITPQARQRLIVVLDGDSLAQVEALIQKLKSEVKNFKISLPLYTAFGPAMIDLIRSHDCHALLDLKYHDIPSSVAKAVAIATRMGVRMINIHASGGHQMMVDSLQAAQDTARHHAIGEPPMIIGVTILTSLETLADIGVQFELREQVVHLAGMAKAAGLHGVLASPLEIQQIRRTCGPQFLIVTPGIRLPHELRDDQRRTSSPRQAIQAGADYIVVGRPITSAKDPVSVTREILKDMSW